MKSACLRSAGVLTLVFLLGTPPVGAASQQGSAVTSERLADFEAELEILRTVLQIPGLAVGIVEAGSVDARTVRHLRVPGDLLPFTAGLRISESCRWTSCPAIMKRAGNR